MTSNDLDFASLLAQRDAAYWACVAALAAWLSVVTAGVGLYLLWRQLAANTAALIAASRSADAAASASEIAFQHSRPWMKLTLNSRESQIFFTPPSGGQDQPPQLSIPIRYENVGQTPALGHLIIPKGVRDPHLDNGASVRAAWDEILATNWNPQEAVFPKEAHEMGMGAWLPWPSDLQSGHFVVLLVSLYKSAIDGPWHATPLLVWLHGPQPTGNPVRAPNGAWSSVILTSGGGMGTHPI